MNAKRLFSVSAWLLQGSHPKHRKGTVAVMAALTLPIFVGTTGFTVDIGLWFAQQTALQTATDAGAMRAARDLATNAATTPAVLSSDAVAAANAATGNQFNFIYPANSQTTANVLTISQLADTRQVRADASIPGMVFFSKVLPSNATTIRASSVAGVAYSTVSTQATCYALDSFTYLYSTGIGTIDTSHSSGIDPFQCGSPPVAPAAYDAYCNGGLLGCQLNVLNAGNLLPFAFQIGPNGGSGGLGPVLSVVTQTLLNLLGGNVASTASGPTVFGPGSAQCPGNVCNIPAGVYNGGLTVLSGVTINFTVSGASHTFLIENGNLTISTQDSLASTSDLNAVFFMAGANPGGYVAATQVLFNTAPINNGAIVLTSTSTFQSTSLAGTQTSAPLSAMLYAQAQAETNGLLSQITGQLGLPVQNLVGTNFESVVAICPLASSFCSNPEDETSKFQSALLLGNEQSVTTIGSSINIANGTATDWQQSEVANSVLTALLGPGPAHQSVSDTGVVVGQTSLGTATCSGKSVLFSKTIAPAYGPSYTNILNVSGLGALTTNDTITVCGTSTVPIVPIAPSQVYVAASAAGASTLSILN